MLFRPPKPLGIASGDRTEASRSPDPIAASTPIHRMGAALCPVQIGRHPTQATRPLKNRGVGGNYSLRIFWPNADRR